VVCCYHVDGRRWCAGQGNVA